MFAYDFTEKKHTSVRNQDNNTPTEASTTFKFIHCVITFWSGLLLFSSSPFRVKLPQR